MTRRLIPCFLLLATLVRADPALDAAIALYNAQRYPDARAAFEKIATREPGNAAACYYLGLTLSHRGDAAALDDAVVWLDKAVQLAPANATYLAGFGGVSLELAGIHTSVTAATRGRDAMEKALELNPGDLEARAGLMQFYERAPWPLGSSAKAAAQLEEIRRRDPDRATVLSVIGKADARDYAAAFKLCDEVLAKQPGNYSALYQFGRTASLSGQRLDRGAACLRQCLALPVPGPSTPSHSYVWNRLGLIAEKLGHAAEARAAYESALKLDPNNREASAALARLR